MARKKRCESIKTTQSKTKERDKGEKNKDGVKKYFPLQRCTVGIAVCAHSALVLHLLLGELKLLESRLQQERVI